MPVDPSLFRRALGNFAAGVTVVTTVDAAGRPAGLTATAFTSVSLSPPLVLVCVDKRAESCPAFSESGVFAVNLLAARQVPLSQRFATSGADKFDGLDWRPGLLGPPVLAGTIGHVECRLRYAYDGGDHTIFVGEVESAEAGPGAPLLYFRGAYRNLDEE